MQSQVKKWGNSASVRIPAAILDEVHMAIDQKVEIRAEDGRIIIEPAQTKITLESLLFLMTPENLHTEADFGAPVGREQL